MVNMPMVGQSPKMREVYRRIERVLHMKATVLITGESGTGKGLIARIIHDHGSRRQGPFTAVNCAAIPETLLEAELFGQFERAAGGTTETLQTDVRIIAAATPDLERVMADGKFRRDLFYRLNIYPIPLPPLRERREDIIPLALHFLDDYRQARGTQVVGLSEEVSARLLGYAWPGNVGELRTVMEQAVGRCRGTVVTVEDLPTTLRPPGG